MKPSSPPALSAISRAGRRVLYEVGTVVGGSPRLAVAAARLSGHGKVLTSDTEVVIEGYPRSGNSFAVAAFEQAQQRATRIAHHTHTPAHVIAAIRAGIPAVVLIRDPEDACVEFAMMKQFLSLHQALRGYVRFYKPLHLYKDEFVVGAFREVTTDFGTVMKRVNARFGTNFIPFEHTEENRQACLDAIDRYWRSRSGPGLPLVGRSASSRVDPSDDSGKRKVLLRQEYRGQGLAHARAQAEVLFRSLSDGA
jgi:hypothetical protein